MMETCASLCFKEAQDINNDNTSDVSTPRMFRNGSNDKRNGNYENGKGNMSSVCETQDILKTAADTDDRKEKRNVIGEEDACPSTEKQQSINVFRSMLSPESPEWKPHTQRRLSWDPSDLQCCNLCCCEGEETSMASAEEFRTAGMGSSEELLENGYDSDVYCMTPFAPMTAWNCQEETDRAFDYVYDSEGDCSACTCSYDTGIEKETVKNSSCSNGNSDSCEYQWNQIDSDGPYGEALTNQQYETYSYLSYLPWYFLQFKSEAELPDVYEEIDDTDLDRNYEYKRRRSLSFSKYEYSCRRSSSFRMKDNSFPSPIQDWNLHPYASAPVSPNRSFQGGKACRKFQRERNNQDQCYVDNRKSGLLVSKNDVAPDLERFLRASCPTVVRPKSIKSLANLQLNSIWTFYERHSALGLECPILGGPRGPSVACYVPYLSSIQLFKPLSDEDGDYDEDAEVFEYQEGLDSWPKRMKRCFSWSASQHIAERPPLWEQIIDICGDKGDGHILKSGRISELHPYSWFAIAWYPLYRIPEAPLSTRFLTFHSLAPFWKEVQKASYQVRDHGAFDDLKRWKVNSISRSLGCVHENQAVGKSSRNDSLDDLHRQSYCSVAAKQNSYHLNWHYQKTLSYSAVHKKNVASLSSVSSLTPTGVCSSFPSSPFTYSDNGKEVVAATGKGDECLPENSSMSGLVAPHSSRSLLFSVDSTMPKCSTQHFIDAAAMDKDSTCMRVSDASSVSHASLSSMSNGTAVSGEDRGDTSYPFCALETRSPAPTFVNPLIQSTHACFGRIEPLSKYIELPAVGLCWHSAPNPNVGKSSRENWLGTLTIKENRSKPASGPCVWESMKVVSRDYPLEKGGPLSWEIQLEELDEGAARLAKGIGLSSCFESKCNNYTQEGIDGRTFEDSDLKSGSLCPDFDFFSSRKR